MALKEKTGGLANVVAGDSKICLCSAEDESLLIRGYTIEDLACYASFEELAYLLLREHLPSKNLLFNYRMHLLSYRELPKKLLTILEEIPGSTHPMDVLRTGVSALGTFAFDVTPDNPYIQQDQLISCLTSILLYWWQSKEGKKPKKLNTEEITTAGNFLTLLHGKPPLEEERRALDISLILYTEHEFNASTFTVRTIASTLSDYYSAITGGIGALKGPLHGGANEFAWNLIQQFKTPDEAEKSLLKMLEKKQLIMGFGHRVYTTNDPRSLIIKEVAKNLSEDKPDGHYFAVAERIEEVMRREKGLFANLDYYSALVYHWLGIPTELFTPLFVISRITGWSAHFLEQQENNKLIRPISNYTGPNKKKWIPINERNG